MTLTYLGASVLLVPLMKRLGLSSVLGYLLAGVVIGPFVLGAVGEEASELMHIAEFGVVMMLFLIGLELNPQVFWKMRHQVLGFGAIQVLGSTILLTLLFSSIPGFEWKAALAVGLAFAMSSTAIVMQGLKEKGLLSSAAGQSSFAVLLFQDIAVIPILALLPLLGDASVGGHSDHPSIALLEHAPVWMRALLDLVAVAGIYLLGTYIVAPALRFVSKSGLREMFTASALLLVVSVAFLMEMVGLSPALGAFVAGVVLANSEFRHELESDIEPFKGLLLGLFFMTVGVSVNFAMIAESPFQVAGIVLTVMLVKALVLYAAGRIFKLSFHANLLFSLGLCQIGEFAFVLITLSGRVGLLSSEWQGKLNAVTAITMMLTPLLLLACDWFLARQQVAADASAGGPAHDVPDQKERVVIAGFGHFGSTVGRVLEAAGIPQTILDVNSDHVQSLRKFGHRAFFGDATRADLLHAAGISDSAVFVAATGSAQVNMQLAKTVRKMAPDVKVLVRAENRLVAYELMEEGFSGVYRETLHTSVLMGVDILIHVGFVAHTARHLGEKFLKYDEEAMEKLVPLRHNKEAYANQIRELVAMQEALLKNDLEVWHGKNKT